MGVPWFFFPFCPPLVSYLAFYDGYSFSQPLFKADGLCPTPEFLTGSQIPVPFPQGPLVLITMRKLNSKSHLAWNYLWALYYIFHTKSKGSLSLMHKSYYVIALVKLLHVSITYRIKFKVQSNITSPQKGLL